MATNMIPSYICTREQNRPSICLAHRVSAVVLSRTSTWLCDHPSTRSCFGARPAGSDFVRSRRRSAPSFGGLLGPTVSHLHLPCPMHIPPSHVFWLAGRGQKMKERRQRRSSICVSSVHTDSTSTYLYVLYREELMSSHLLRKTKTCAGSAKRVPPQKWAFLCDNSSLLSAMRQYRSSLSFSGAA